MSLRDKLLEKMRIDQKAARKAKSTPKFQPKPAAKRPTAKVVVVSDDTHARLKDYAKKCGYKTQYLADIAIAEYLNRQEKQ
jgi:hypothetical protein